MEAISKPPGTHGIGGDAGECKHTNFERGCRPIGVVCDSLRHGHMQNCSGISRATQEVSCEQFVKISEADVGHLPAARTNGTSTARSPVSVRYTLRGFWAALQSREYATEGGSTSMADAGLPGRWYRFDSCLPLQRALRALFRRCRFPVRGAATPSITSAPSRIAAPLLSEWHTSLEKPLKGAGRGRVSYSEFTGSRYSENLSTRGERGDFCLQDAVNRRRHSLGWLVGIDAMHRRGAIPRQDRPGLLLVCLQPLDDDFLAIVFPVD